MPIATGGVVAGGDFASAGWEESVVRHIVDLVRTHPLHAGVIGFFLFVVFSALFLERARYRHH